MKGFSLIFSDLISVALVAYVWARMYTHSALEPRAVRLFRNIGITLLATLAVDHVWQYFFNISDGSAASRQLLNTISSLEFLCVPSTLFFCSCTAERNGMQPTSLRWQRTSRSLHWGY